MSIRSDGFFFPIDNRTDFQFIQAASLSYTQYSVCALISTSHPTTQFIFSDAMDIINLTYQYYRSVHMFLPSYTYLIYYSDLWNSIHSSNWCWCLISIIGIGRYLFIIIGTAVNFYSTVREHALTPATVFFHPPEPHGRVPQCSRPMDGYDLHNDFPVIA